MDGFLVSRTCLRASSMVSGRSAGAVVGVNTAYAMEASGERGMAEDRSLSERSIDGGCRASTSEPELPGEVTGGLEVIEYD